MTEICCLNYTTWTFISAVHQHCNTIPNLNVTLKSVISDDFAAKGAQARSASTEFEAIAYSAAVAAVNNILDLPSMAVHQFRDCDNFRSTLLLAIWQLLCLNHAAAGPPMNEAKYKNLYGILPKLQVHELVELLREHAARNE